MSAYIVDNSTINKVLAYFRHDAASNRSCARFALEQAGYDPHTTEGLRGLGNEMLRLNIYGVDERYGEGQGMEMGGACGFTYESGLPPALPQALMSLQCWLYQCSEGDCVERPLYKLMRDIERSMMHNLIRTIPAYENATWG